MKAAIFYYIERQDYGNSSDKTGWYLMRATLIDDRGKGLAGPWPRTAPAVGDRRRSQAQVFLLKVKFAS